METKIELSFSDAELEMLSHTAMNQQLFGWLCHRRRFVVVRRSDEITNTRKHFENTLANIKIFDCLLKAKIFAATLSKNYYAILFDDDSFSSNDDKGDWIVWYSAKEKEEENDDTRRKEAIFKASRIQPKVAGPRTPPEEKKKFVAKRRERTKKD